MGETIGSGGKMVGINMGEPHQRHAAACRNAASFDEAPQPLTVHDKGE